MHRSFPFGAEGKDFPRETEPESLTVKGNLVRITLGSGASEFVVTDINCSFLAEFSRVQPGSS